MFVNVSHFHLSLVYASKAGAYHSGAPNGTLLWKLASSLAWNIRLEWKWLTLTNTLAYYNTSRITAVKSFIVPAPSQKNRCLICFRLWHFEIISDPITIYNKYNYSNNNFGDTIVEKILLFYSSKRVLENVSIRTIFREKAQT